MANENNELDPRTIVQAEIVPAKGFGDMATVRAKMSDGQEVQVFRYFDDELSFRAEEFTGMTLLQAHKLFHKKDVAYLQS